MKFKDIGATSEEEVLQFLKDAGLDISERDKVENIRSSYSPRASR